MKGVTVYLIGSKDGPEPMDLGDLLEWFNETCNSDALFDATRVLSTDGERIVFRHTCGMLGVPGDIQGKTLLHGIHTAFICRSLRKSRCIGDDARIQLQIHEDLDRILLETQLQNIGRISIEKSEEFEYDDEDDYDLLAWHFAKRPFLRTRNRILQFYMFTFPTLDCILGLSDSARTTIPGSMEITSRRNKFHSIWFRLLRVLILHSQDLTDEERQFLYDYQKRAFVELGIIGRRPGVYREDGSLYRVPPFMSVEEFGHDYRESVVQLYDLEEVVEVVMECHEVVQPVGYVGEEFCSRGIPIFGFMVKMGILQRRMVFEGISRSMIGDEQFVERLFGTSDPKYEFSVMKEIPTWMYTLMHK